MTKMILYKSFLGYEATTEANYKAVIQNPRLITKFYDFETVQEILDYYERYFKIPASDIYIVESLW